MTTFDVLHWQTLMLAYTLVLGVPCCTPLGVDKKGFAFLSGLIDTLYYNCVQLADFSLY